MKTSGLEGISSNGYSFLIEMLYRAQRLGSSVGELPIRFIDWERGTSKISKSEIFKALSMVLRLAWCAADPIPL